MRLAGLAAAVAAGLFLVAGGSAADPVTCAGYPEPRVFLESQSWWTDTETLTDGDTEHVHSGVCFPLSPTVVSGQVTLDVVSKMHNVAGQKLRRVRLQAATDQGGLRDVADTYPNLTCTEHDCTFTTSLTINTDALATGTHEIRVQSFAEKQVSGRPTNLATSGYMLCVRSCSGVTPQATDSPEGRGWYKNAQGKELGYAVARYDSLSLFPRNPVSGRWCPPVRFGRGYSGDTPHERSRVVVDPNFHAGDPGRTYLNVSGAFRGTVCIDTTQLTNGPHKLVLIAYSSAKFPGQLSGVFVVPFTVTN